MLVYFLWFSKFIKVHVLSLMIRLLPLPYHTFCSEAEELLETLLV